MNTFVPKLYILVRTDMDTMNPGRVAAQVSHLPFALLEEMIEKTSKKKHPFQVSELKEIFDAWSSETEQGFGTTIILDADSIENIENLVNQANSRTKVFSGIVVDPTYPIKDGNVIHLVNIPTCAYILCNNSDYTDLDHLPLYNGVPQRLKQKVCPDEINI